MSDEHFRAQLTAIVGVRSHTEVHWHLIFERIATHDVATELHHDEGSPRGSFKTTSELKVSDSSHRYKPGPKCSVYQGYIKEDRHTDKRQVSCVREIFIIFVFHLINQPSSDH